MDPAAENFDYQPLVDIRDLITVDDAMEDEELHYGPNGGLVFCIEYENVKKSGHCNLNKHFFLFFFFAADI